MVENKEQPSLYSENLDEVSPIGGDVSEVMERRREAIQAHGFRESAFRWIGILCGVVGLLWVGLMAQSPDVTAPKEVFYLWGVKMSLCTVVLVTIAISLLRFAIKCYGHHQHSARDDEISSPVKLAETALKVAHKAME